MGFSLTNTIQLLGYPHGYGNPQDFQGENGLDLDAFREMVNDGAQAMEDLWEYLGRRFPTIYRFVCKSILYILCVYIYIL